MNEKYALAINDTTKLLMRKMDQLADLGENLKRVGNEILGNELLVIAIEIGKDCLTINEAMTNQVDDDFKASQHAFRDTINAINSEKE